MISATNHELGRAAREKNDFYETPLPVAIAVVQELSNRFLLDQTMNILDAGCGNGIWGRAIETVIPGCRQITGVEIDTARAKAAADSGYYKSVILKDFLDPRWHWAPNYIDVVIGNPPFKYAEAFIRQALRFTKDAGTVCFLLPANFWMGGIARHKGLFSEHPPMTCVKLPKRIFPGFSQEICLLIWSKGYKGETKTRELIV